MANFTIEEKLADKLGIKLVNKELLHQALVHRSYLNENGAEKESNERLEFLGDAVLEFLVSRRLFTEFSSFPEGILTNLRARLVNTQALAELAGKLNLGEALYLSKGEDLGGGRKNNSLLADTFEAVLGAVYVDKGVDACEKILENMMFPQLKKVDLENLKDAKSRLQEIVQAKNLPTPIYNLVRSEGPDHAKRFWVEVKTGEQILGRGEGESKQIAEQKAAEIAMRDWQN